MAGEEDRSGRGEGIRREGRARRASRHRARCLALACFRGNEAVLEKNLTIDITPPTLELIADDRYVNFGGVGAIVYKASRGHGDERA